MMRRLLLLLAVSTLLGGCASAFRLELPDEFKGKKVKEDPPISQGPCPTVREVRV